MESFNGKEITSPSHVQANHDHLLGNIWGPKAAQGRATDYGATHPVELVQTHPVEPTKPTTPTKPVEPTHPVEPTKPTAPTHPVEPQTQPTHPVEPPTHPVEPQRNFSPPAEPFRPRIPEKQETKNPPSSKDSSPTGDHPVPQKPVVVVTPPEHSTVVPPPTKSHTEPTPDKPNPSSPKHSGKGGEFSVTIDHSYKSDETHQTIRHTVVHSDQQSSVHAQAKSTSHEHQQQREHQQQHQQHRSTTHHSSHSHHSGHHESAPHHSSFHSVHHRSHHETAHHAENHHAAKATQHVDNHHSSEQHKVVQKAQHAEQAHKVDVAAQQHKRKDIETTTIHTDTKHVEEHTTIHINGTLPDSTPPEQAPKPLEPVAPPAQTLRPSDSSTTNVEPKSTTVDAPPPVQSPPAEPVHVDTPASQHALKPADTNELSTAISQGQVSATLTHEHHLDPKTYVRGSVMAGVAGDHVGLGNTELTFGRHLFNPYDANGNPARGNLNLEAGGIFKTGHTYDYGKLPRFGDTSAHVGLNGYYQPKHDLTLYGSADFATNPKQHDYQFGAIFDSKKTSLQLGFEQSKIDGYGTSNYFTPGLSFKTGKNTSVYVSGAIDMDGHKDRNGLWTGFRLGF
ncbi:MAG TPA: hypothetical protein V6C76_16185 [Drouetiella sp.]